jgi:ribonuclease VapC
MVIDTSAIFAILNGEPEAETFANAILNDSTRLISTGTALEISIVVRARKGEPGIKELDSFLSITEIDIIDFDENQLTMARYAFEHYGKGMDNSAKLNFGDCFAYALSKTSGEPLLFKGDDFSQTDITVVI